MSSQNQTEHKSQTVASALAATLADTFALYMKTHAFHWNVTGPQFMALHALFEEQYTDMWQATDEIAERIRSLGEFAPWSYNQIVHGSSISSDKIPFNTEKMLEELIEGHRYAVQTTKESLKIAQDHEDDVSADLLTGRLAFHEKQLWMLHSTIK